MNSCKNYEENYIGNYKTNGCSYSTGDHSIMGNRALQNNRHLAVNMPKNYLNNLIHENYISENKKNTGNYNILGNKKCQKLNNDIPGNPAIKEHYCGSCNKYRHYENEMGKDYFTENYCSSCNRNSNYNKFNYDKLNYDKLNYDVIEENNLRNIMENNVENFHNYDKYNKKNYRNEKNPRTKYLGNFDFPPAAIMVPHQFVNNMKLSIEDPDNQWTYWLGGSPFPCKNGKNETTQRRKWLGA